MLIDLICLFMTSECTSCGTCSLWGSNFCMRPVALAGASGGLAGWFLQVLREAAFDYVPDPLVTSSSLEASVCNCLAGGVELLGLIIGVVLGLALGPVLECLFLLRQLWSLYLRNQFSSLRPARTGSYRVLGWALRSRPCALNWLLWGWGVKRKKGGLRIKRRGYRGWRREERLRGQRLQETGASISASCWNEAVWQEARVWAATPVFLRGH